MSENQATFGRFAVTLAATLGFSAAALATVATSRSDGPKGELCVGDARGEHSFGPFDLSTALSGFSGGYFTMNRVALFGLPDQTIILCPNGRINTQFRTNILGSIVPGGFENSINQRTLFEAWQTQARLHGIERITDIDFRAIQTLRPTPTGIVTVTSASRDNMDVKSLFYFDGTSLQPIIRERPVNSSGSLDIAEYDLNTLFVLRDNTRVTLINTEENRMYQMSLPQAIASSEYNIYDAAIIDGSPTLVVASSFSINHDMYIVRETATREVTLPNVRGNYASLMIDSSGRAIAVDVVEDEGSTNRTVIYHENLDGTWNSEDVMINGDFLGTMINPNGNLTILSIQINPNRDAYINETLVSLN